MVRVAPQTKLNALLADQPHVFFRYGGSTVRNGSLGVRLADVAAAQMEPLVVASWMHVASKRAIGAWQTAASPGGAKKQSLADCAIARRDPAA